MIRRDDEGQLQLVEVITVAVILFTAIAISAVFRLPTSPATFQGAELERIGSDTLRVMVNTKPRTDADCNEPAGDPCPFAEGSELERMLSLAVGYVGPTDEGESPDREPFEDFLRQAMPDGVNWIVYYSNGVTATKVVPQERNPPLLDVYVARTLLSPAWTTFADHLGESVLVRTGEPGGFGTATTVRDPLNRDQTEFGDLLTDRFDADVPEDAMLGTHEICYGADCHYFTVTPSNIFGAGSQILAGDRDASTNLKDLGGFFTRVHYVDDDTSGSYTLGQNPLYIDADAGTTVNAGDVRLTPVAACRTGVDCPAGSFVIAGDSDDGGTLATFDPVTPNVEFRVHDADSDSALSVGDTIYLTSTGAASVAADQPRMSRVGVDALGTSVASGDLDEGRGLGLASTAARLWYDDTNDDGALDPDEAVYLDLDGSGLEPGDYHLTAEGEATAQQFYDVRLVVWFGV